MHLWQLGTTWARETLRRIVVSQNFRLWQTRMPWLSHTGWDASQRTQKPWTWDFKNMGSARMWRRTWFSMNPFSTLLPSSVLSVVAFVLEQSFWLSPYTRNIFPTNWQYKTWLAKGQFWESPGMNPTNFNPTKKWRKVVWYCICHFWLSCLTDGHVHTGCAACCHLHKNTYCVVEMLIIPSRVFAIFA